MKAQERPQARYVKPGEMLAMDPIRLHRGPDSFFWMFGEAPKPNERIGDVAVVSIRGELEHHKDAWGCTESYEGIVERFEAALTGQDCADQHMAEHGTEADFKAREATPPSCVILCIDSPGGVVAGLNETVRALRKMKADAKVPVYVFVNEMAASAAYALATVGDEIICPRSAILGSIGVISTMISQAKKNAKDGYDVRLLTSGARKADGHLHAPISDDAIKVEMDRVEKLAGSFFKLVSKARGLSVEKIQSFEAGIFLGPDAVKRGLADSILSFDDLLLGVREATSGETDSAGEAGGNQTDRRLRSSSVKKLSMSQHSTEAVMPIALSALIKKTEAKIASEKDPKKLSSLLSALEAYKKTKHTIEKHESESGDEEEESSASGDDEDDEDEDEESKAASPMKKDEEEESSASGDDEDEEEESEEASAKAALQLVNTITGMTGKKALGALQALAATAANTAKDVAALKKVQRASAKASLIEGARTKGQITKAEATFLAGQKVSTVEGFVAMRAKSGFVHTDEGTMAKPKHVQPGTEESLSAETREMINSAVANFPGDKKAFRAQLVSAHLESATRHVSAVLNGANGRI